MKKSIITTLLAAAAAAAVIAGAASCSKRGQKLAAETDSLSYVIGLNVGRSLMQMDSTLNVDVVCAAIRDAFAETPKMTMDDARNYFLRQMNYAKYEKFKLYEERFLADLSKRDRSFVRTKSGVTYRVTAPGDQQTLASNQRDTLLIRYRLLRQDGSLVESSYDRADTLRSALSDLVTGLQEVMRMVGGGGRADAWIPSDLAFGAAGNGELGIEPNSTLLYEVEVIDVIPYRRR